MAMARQARSWWAMKTTQNNNKKKNKTNKLNKYGYSHIKKQRRKKPASENRENRHGIHPPPPHTHTHTHTQHTQNNSFNMYRHLFHACSLHIATKERLPDTVVDARAKAERVANRRGCPSGLEQPTEKEEKRKGEKRKKRPGFRGKNTKY